MKAVASALVLIAGGYGLGVVTYRHDLPPMPAARAAKQWLTERLGWAEPAWRIGYRDTSDRVVTDCARLTGPDTAILLTFGQSNAGNHGASGFDSGPDVYNFNLFDGRCYVARDPLLGTTGTGGSVWTRLGARLIARGLARRVVIAPIAVGPSSIRSWVPGQDYFRRIEAAVAGLAAVSLAPTHWLWHQGESDAGVLSRAEYQTRFWDIERGIRALGADAPIYVAVASICVDRGSDAIRDAQRALAHSRPNLWPGPDTDTLVHVWDRYDSCHFSAEGLETHAALWLDALEQSAGR